MRKSIFKKTAAVLMCCTVALTNMSAFNTEVFAEDDVLDFAGDSTEYTAFENLKGDFEKTANGYVIKKVNGDNHNISDLKSLAFVYESDVTFIEGSSASLIFGAEGNTLGNLGKFFGLELSRDGGNSSDIFIKMFQNPLGVGLGDNVIPRTKVAEVADNSQPIHFKVSVDEAKNLSIYINGDKVEYTFDKDFKSAYTSGYLGLLTWNTQVAFDNFKLTTVEEAPADFRTNLVNLHGLGGTWTETSEGLFSSGNNDNFALSDTSVANFEYTANIKNTGNKGAGALVFRAADNPASDSYVFNVDYSNRVFKLFSFPSGGTVKEVPLSSIPEKTDGSYDVKVQAVGDRILIYVNNKGIIDVKDTQHTNGKLGLLTWNGSATYQDVMYKELNTLPNVEKPQLTKLDIKTAGVSITPEFDKKESIYGMDIKPGINKVKVDVEANGKMSITKKDKHGNVIKAKEDINDSFTIEQDEFFENYMNIYLTVETSDGFTKDILFTVYKWYSPEELAEQEYRSQFHVTPQTNFMNDPNGMVYDSSDGYWHLFYQQSTTNNFKQQSWGHVRSKDLINWEQQPLGIQIDEDGLIFSGSAIEDKDNTSGLFDDNLPGESKLIAYYTLDTPNVMQSQAIAYSKDHGVTWKKHGIVVPNTETISGINFRDPKVFKLENTWYMVTAGGSAQIHTSTDLIHWNKSQALKFKNGDQINSECPMLYPAKVNGTGEEKWIYGGSAGFYVVGNMVKDNNGIYKWTAESDVINVDSNENPWGGFGKYATMTFNEDGTGQNRQIGISWLIDFVDFDGREYRGVQTLPQEYGLRQDADGKYIITSKPVEEVENLRDMNNILYSRNDQVVQEADGNILKGISGIRYDLEAEFTLGTAKEFGFKLRKGNGKELIFKYDVNAKQMKLDVSNAGPHTNSGNYSYTLAPTTDGKVKLRIIIDQGAVEAFGNDGEANISTITYTDNNNIGMEFFTKDGDVKIDKLNIYDMKSMYSKKSGSESESTKLFISAPEYVKVGEVFEVSANVYPNKGDGNVVWSYDDSFVPVTRDSTNLMLKATKKGNHEIKATTKDGSLVKKINLNVIEPNFETNIDEWNIHSGNWDITDKGLHGANASAGDSFNLTDTYLENDVPFTFESDIHIESGQAAGLVFGVKNKDNPGSYWYCANIDKTTNGGIAKLFKNTGGQDWDVSQPLTQEQKDKKDYKVRVEYDGNGKLSYYLDDVLIGERSNSGFDGGYLGVLTFRADATFNNVFATASGTIVEVTTQVEDIHVLKNSDVNDVVAQLPQQVNVKQDNGIIVSANATWDVSNLDTSVIGSNVVTASIAGTALTLSANVHVSDAIVDKEELKDLLDTVDQMDLTKYEAAGVEVLNTKVSVARILVTDISATQEAVDTSVLEVKQALAGLVEKSASLNTDGTTNSQAPSTNPNQISANDTANKSLYLMLLGLSVMLGGSIVIFQKRKNKQN